MDVIKGKESVELIKDEKHLKISLESFDQLVVSFFKDDKEGHWFQESFEVNKNDDEVYNIVDGTFLSYSGDVFFDTYGANLVLLNEEGKYNFVFLNEHTDLDNEIKCKFFNDSIENRSMLYMYNRLCNIAKTEEKPKTLSKTLNNIVEK